MLKAVVAQIMRLLSRYPVRVMAAAAIIQLTLYKKVNTLSMMILLGLIATIKWTKIKRVKRGLTLIRGQKCGACDGKGYFKGEETPGFRQEIACELCSGSGQKGYKRAA